MGLSPKQIRAAELLAKGHSQEQAGRAVGASRRTVSRWLQQEDFRNLSFGLVGRNAPLPPQRSVERRQANATLTPQDLVEDALRAVQGVLQDPDVRNADKLKAASLVGAWAGLETVKNKMAEMEAMKVLCEAGWLPEEVLEVIIESDKEMSEKIADAFYGCFRSGKPEESPKMPNPPPWPRDPWV